MIHTRALGADTPVAAVLDHSLGPGVEHPPLGWPPAGGRPLAWIIEPATRHIGGHEFTGFSYSFRFHSRHQQIYYLLDRGELGAGGQRARGQRWLRQQMGEDPRVTLRARTSYNTSACINFPLNPIMTHDVPRWASEQGFDYQYKGGDALIGLFAHCGLIRTIVVRGRRGRGDSPLR